jgi:hypothetical protein
MRQRYVVKRDSLTSGVVTTRNLPQRTKRPGADPTVALATIVSKINANRGPKDAYSRGSLRMSDPGTGQEVHLEWENGTPERWWQGLYRVLSIKLKASIQGRVDL